jgi:hypothetical protein
MPATAFALLVSFLQTAFSKHSGCLVTQSDSSLLTVVAPSTNLLSIYIFQLLQLVELYLSHKLPRLELKELLFAVLVSDYYRHYKSAEHRG